MSVHKNPLGLYGFKRNVSPQKIVQLDAIINEEIVSCLVCGSAGTYHSRILSDFLNEKGIIFYEKTIEDENARKGKRKIVDIENPLVVNGLPYFDVKGMGVFTLDNNSLIYGGRSEDYKKYVSESHMQKFYDLLYNEGFNKIDSHGLLGE